MVLSWCLGVWHTGMAVYSLHTLLAPSRRGFLIVDTVNVLSSSTSHLSLRSRKAPMVPLTRLLLC